MDNTKSFGERLKELRKSRKLTQPQLAEKVGRNPHTIKDYEAGRASPSLQALELLSKALGVSQKDLMDSAAPIPAPVSAPPSQSLRKFLKVPDDVVEMAQDFNLNDEVWDMVRVAMRNGLKNLQKEQSKKNLA